MQQRLENKASPSKNTKCHFVGYNRGVRPYFILGGNACSVLYLLYLLYHQIVDQSSSFEIQPRAPRLILADSTSELPCPCYIDASPITASMMRKNQQKSESIN